MAAAFACVTMAASGAFAGGGPTTTTLAFYRKTSNLLSARNSAGELVLSFTSVATVTLALDPKGGDYPRFVHGTVAEVNFTGIATANLDLREGDRTRVSGAWVEIVNVQHYGTAQTVLDLNWVR